MKSTLGARFGRNQVRSKKPAAPAPRPLTIGVMERRRVHYWLYVGHAVGGEKTVSELDTMLCASEEDASSRAVAHANRCERGEYFRKTVYIYYSGPTWMFGFFVCKTMEPKPSVFVNLNSVASFDCQDPVDELWVRGDSINADPEPAHFPTPDSLLAGPAGK